MHVSSIAFVSVPKPSLNYNIEKLPIIWKIHSRISQVFFSSPLQIFRHYSWQDKVIRATGNIIFFTINLCFLRLIYVFYDYPVWIYRCCIGDLIICWLSPFENYLENKILCCQKSNLQGAASIKKWS